MSADLCRRAAARARELAEAATHLDATDGDRWITEHHNSEYHDEPDRCHIAADRKGVYWTVASEVYIPNAEHMAAWDPTVALAVADWLDYIADLGEEWGDLPEGARLHPNTGYALAVARALLREEAT